MSDLENVAQRLLLSLMRGEHQPLDRLQLRSIAIWLAVKSIVWEAQEFVKAKSIPQSDRSYIYNNREVAAWRLPENWYAWIGATDADFGVCGAYHLGALVVRTDPDGSIWPKPIGSLPSTVHCFAMFAGAFIGLVLRSPFVGDGPLFRQDSQQALRPIWPYVGNCDWPPRFVFPANEIWALPQNFVDAIVEGLS